MRHVPESFDAALAELRPVIRHRIRRYLRPWHTDTQRDEMQQAARIGAWHAWRRFDASRASWQTYASLFVDAYVARSVLGSKRQRESAKWRYIAQLVPLDEPTIDGGLTLSEMLPAPLEDIDEALDRPRRLEAARAAVLAGDRTHDARVRLVPVGEVTLRHVVGGETLRVLAEEYGVSKQAVSLAIQRRLLKARETVRHDA